MHMWYHLGQRVGALILTPPEAGKGVGDPRWILTSFLHGLTYNCDGGFKVAVSVNMAVFIRNLPRLQGIVTSRHWRV